jgi:hypothetical protein
LSKEFICVEQANDAEMADLKNIFDSGSRDTRSFPPSPLSVWIKKVSARVAESEKILAAEEVAVVDEAKTEHAPQSAEFERSDSAFAGCSSSVSHADDF